MGGESRRGQLYREHVKCKRVTYGSIPYVTGYLLCPVGRQCDRDNVIPFFFCKHAEHECMKCFETLPL